MKFSFIKGDKIYCILLTINPLIKVKNTMSTTATPDVVKDTCMSACKMMKLLSKQLIVLSTTYEKIPLNESCAQIYETMGVVIESTRKMQESMIKTGNAINEDMDSGVEGNTFTDQVVMSQREYRLLTSVFQHQMDIQNDIISSSEPFSLFSSPLLYTPSGDQ